MGRALRRAARVLGVLLLAAALAGAWAWRDRADLDALDVPHAEPAAPRLEGSGIVTATWLGVTTILFDDGETRLLTDGFFSRPGVLDLALGRPVAPDGPGLARALRAAEVDTLAAVMPVHSHYDHAMDAGEVAKRTGARVLGSASTANAARGAGLPEARIVTVQDGDRHRFGRFTVTFLRSRHVEARDGRPPLPGTIDAPLVPPAPVSAWREGGSFSIVLDHPQGTALVQGSAGFLPGALDGVEADVVFLGVGALARHGPAYTRRYWDEIVGATGARRVLVAHFDDFTRPWGEVRPFPRLLDDVETTFRVLAAKAAEARTSVRVEIPPFGEPVRLFAGS